MVRAGISVGLIGESGEFNTNGISVFRNTNGDTTEVCGYTAFLEHFSTYATVPIISSGGGSGSSDSNPPSIRGTVYDDGEYPLTINGMQYSDVGYSNKIKTNEIRVGEEFNISLLIDDGVGGSDIEFIGLFTNLNGHERQIYQSDTYITYDIQEKLQYFDPNGFLSNVEMEQKKIGDKLEMRFDITFDKEMPTSDIIIRMWDINKNSQDTILSEVIKVTESDTSKSTNKTIVEKVQTTNFGFKNTIEKWGGYQSKVISDMELMEYLGINIDNKNKIKIPTWFKTNFSQWIVSDTLNEEDIKEALEWMKGKGIL